MAEKRSPALGRASCLALTSRPLVLDVQRGAVAGLAVAVSKLGTQGFQHAAVAVAVRTGLANSIDAIAGQGAVLGACATLRQTLVVLVRTALVGLASHFDAQIRVALPDLDR